MQYLTSAYSSVLSALPYAPSVWPTIQLLATLGIKFPFPEGDHAHRHLQSRVDEEWKKRQLGVLGMSLHKAASHTPQDQWAPLFMQGNDDTKVSISPTPVRVLPHTSFISSTLGALGTTLTRNDLILAYASFAAQDPEGFFFCAKHEAAHIAHDDAVTNSLIRSCSTIALPLILTSVHPLVKFGVSFVADRVLSYYTEKRAEWRADETAILRSSNEELLGAIRYFVAERAIAIWGTHSKLSRPDGHGEVNSRIEAIKNECKKRGIIVPKEIDKEKLIPLIATFVANCCDKSKEPFLTNCFCRVQLEGQADGLEGLSVDIDEVYMAIGRQTLLAYPQLCSTESVHSQEKNNEVDLFEKTFVVHDTDLAFDPASIHEENALLQVYRQVLDNAGIQDKKVILSKATKLLLNYLTGDAVFIDAQGKSITLLRIPLDDLAALSGPERDATLQKVATAWSTLPITFVCFIAGTPTLQKIAQKQHHQCMQNLMQKYGIQYVTFDPADQKEIFVRFMPEVSHHNIQAKLSGFLEKLIVTIIKLDELNIQLKSGFAISTSTKNRWKDEIKKQPHYREFAKTYFPNADTFFSELVDEEELLSAFDALSLDDNWSI